MGWRQLSHGRSRMIVALVGVAVAVLLMLTVLSLKEAVFRSSLLIPSSLRGDFIVVSPRTQSMMRPARMPARLLDRLLGIAGVASVTPVTVETGRWVNPWTRQEHPIRVWGMDLQADVLGLPGIDPGDPVLRTADAALFDELARPKFGPVAAELRAGRPVQAEVNGRSLAVIGLTRAGVSVGVDGNLFTTPANYQRLFPAQPVGACHLGTVRLEPGADAAGVLAAARAMLGPEAIIMPRSAIIDAEIAYMRANEPVDFIMTMIASVAFAVGMIIVYQILYSDVINHLPQFATLKAMGFSDGYLLRIVMSEGIYLSLIGFWPGLAAAIVLTNAAQSIIILPVAVTPDRAALVLGLTIVMCCVAAAAAVRKLAQADPANVF
jgi:putative ABC transport system permease protein